MVSVSRLLGLIIYIYIYLYIHTQLNFNIPNTTGMCRSPNHLFIKYFTLNILTPWIFKIFKIVKSSWRWQSLTINLYLCMSVSVQKHYINTTLVWSFWKVGNQVLKSLVRLLFHCSLSMVQPGIGILVKITSIMAIVASRGKVLLADRASLSFWHVPVIKISWL